MPQNDSQSLPFVKSPDFEPTAGFQERAWTSLVQAVKGGVVSGAIGALGGAALGALAGLIYAPSEEQIREAISKGATPGAGAEPAKNITDVILKSLSTASKDLPKADLTAGHIQNSLIGGTALAGGMAGLVTGAAGGAIVKGVEGGLWTDYLKRKEAVLDGLDNGVG